jgi:hypothetical protein
MYNGSASISKFLDLRGDVIGKYGLMFFHFTSSSPKTNFNLSAFDRNCLFVQPYSAFASIKII